MHFAVMRKIKIKKKFKNPLRCVLRLSIVRMVHILILKTIFWESSIHQDYLNFNSTVIMTGLRGCGLFQQIGGKKATTEVLYNVQCLLLFVLFNNPPLVHWGLGGVILHTATLRFKMFLKGNSSSRIVILKSYWGIIFHCTILFLLKI